MKAFFIKYFYLLNLKTINENNKEKLQDSYLKSCDKLTDGTDKMTNLVHKAAIDIRPSQGHKVNQEGAYHSLIENQILGILENNEPYDEKVELFNTYTNFLQKVVYNKKLFRIFDSNGPINADFAQAESDIDSLLAQNKKLNNNLLDCVEKEEALNKELKDLLSNKKLLSINEIREKKGSLLDDYADLNTDMPSYMDPED